MAKGSSKDKRMAKRQWSQTGDFVRKFLDVGTLAFYQINGSDSSFFKNVPSVVTMTTNELVVASYEELIAFIDLIDLWVHRKTISKRDFLAQLSKDLAKLTIVNPSAQLGAILMIVGCAMSADSKTGQLLSKFGLGFIVASHFLSGSVSWMPKDRRQPKARITPRERVNESLEDDGLTDGLEDEDGSYETFSPGSGPGE